MDTAIAYVVLVFGFTVVATVLRWLIARTMPDDR